jgi:hypothetical protein
MLIGLLSVLAIVSCKEKKKLQKLRLTKLLKSLKKLLRQKKSLMEHLCGTDGVDVSTKNGTSSTSVNVSGGKAKVEVKK